MINQNIEIFVKKFVKLKGDLYCIAKVYCIAFRDFGIFVKKIRQIEGGLQSALLS